MGAPTPSTRSTRIPAGTKMPNGHQSLLTFSSNLIIRFFELELKMPGINGGEPIDITTFFNSLWRTKAPRALLELEVFTFKAGYDPHVVTDIKSMCNANAASYVSDTVTIHLPNLGSYCFYGYLQKSEFDDNKEGTFPMCNGTVVPTMTDSAGVEQGPVYTPSSGT